MGFTPHDVRSLSLSDFGAAMEGWQMANVPPSKEPDFGPEARARLDEIVEAERVNDWRRRSRKIAKW